MIVNYGRLSGGSKESATSGAGAKTGGLSKDRRLAVRGRRAAQSAEGAKEASKEGSASATTPATAATTATAAATGTAPDTAVTEVAGGTEVASAEGASGASEGTAEEAEEAAEPEETEEETVQRVFLDAKARVLEKFGSFGAKDNGATVSVVHGSELDKTRAGTGRAATSAKGQKLGFTAVTESARKKGKPLSAAVKVRKGLLSKGEDQLLGTLVHEVCHALSINQGPLGQAEQIRNEGITEIFTRQVVEGRSTYQNAVDIMTAENTALGISNEVLARAYFGGNIEPLREVLESAPSLADATKWRQFKNGLPRRTAASAAKGAKSSAKSGDDQ
jgi:hypothetical protein